MATLPDHFHATYRFDGGRRPAIDRKAKHVGDKAEPPQRQLRSRPSKGVTHQNPDGKETETEPKTEPSTAPRKRRRVNARTETFNPILYPHVTDHLSPTDPTRQLDILICGLNPGLRSSQRGLHFAHPSNHFYRTLYLGGLTPTVVKPEDCAALVDQRPISIGLTNICCRPTREGSQLKREDFVMGTPELSWKIARLARPKLTVFTGKGIGSEWVRCCKEVGALRAGKKEEQDEKGLQDARQMVTLPFPESVPFAPDNSQGLGLMPYVLDLGDDDDISTPSHKRCSFLFLVTSPSGRVTTMHLPEKGQWMGKARECLEYLWDTEKTVGEGTAVKKEEEAGDDKVKVESQSMVWRQFEIVQLTSVVTET